jgi:two-component system sensor histidine kinase BaeS
VEGIFVKIRLSYKIFGAFLLTSVAIVALTIGVLRFFIYHHFEDYINKMEMKNLEELMETLKVEYRDQQGWERLRSSRGLWRKMVRSNFHRKSSEASTPSVPEDWPDEREEIAHSPGLRPPVPQRDFFHIGSRLFLLDDRKRPVAGIMRSTDNQVLEEIRIQDKTVGWLGLKKRKPMQTPLEMAFLQAQYELFYLLGAGIICITMVVSFLLSGHLLGPIRKLADGTQALTNRQFKTRINVHAKDELGQLASGFNVMAQTLETYEQMQKQWISDISHELRTPLSILRGEIEAVQDGVREVNRKTLDSLHSEVLHVAKIVDDLHELSMADSGAFYLNRKPTNPVWLLRETLNRLRTRFMQARIRIQDDLGSEQGIIMLADGDRLAQLYSNLLENTIRYTDAPGILRLWRERTESHLYLNFEDSGPGVPEESLKRLFDRLYRVDSSRSRSKGGSGLGLAICKTIVEAHGGEITALKGRSGGLRIQMAFPLVSALSGSG